MSRDFTPRETYLVEQQQIKQGYGSLWDFMKNTTITYNGKTWPLHTEEEIETRMKFPMLGKLLNKFKEFYSVLSAMPGGLEFLSVCDNEVAAFVSHGEGDVNSPTIKWFLGELDEGFYYSERNEELFLEYIQDEVKRNFQSQNQESICVTEINSENPVKEFTLNYVNEGGDTVARDYFDNLEAANDFIDKLIETYKTHNENKGLILEDNEGNLVRYYEPENNKKVEKNNIDGLIETATLKVHEHPAARVEKVNDENLDR